jgi:phosphoglycolate phosphatase-like HAD superfamily hydrolase
VAPVAILDVDGTLVDTNYHHALAWYRAFRAHGITLPLRRLHRHVGMGGDKYVAALAGDTVEKRIGDEIRSDWERLFNELLPETAPVDCARQLVVDLKERGKEVVLASSAIAAHVDAFLDKLQVRDLVDSWTTKDDVEKSKPDPDLVCAALGKTRSRDAVMVGDTPWYVEAARRARLETICVITGGFSRHELLEAGAAAVYESVDELRRRLGETQLA